jgi:hypothetical protein
MKLSQIFLPAILAGALSLCSCAPLPRKVAYDESAFVPYRGSGSGAIVGTAFVQMRDKTIRTATHLATVKLMPATPYTEEVAKVVFEGGRKLEPPDPRFIKYIRKVHPDDDGHFAFHNLPPGNYYIGSHLHWTYPATSTDGDGNTTSYDADVDQWIYDHVSVKNGQTLNEEDRGKAFGGLAAAFGSETMG